MNDELAFLLEQEARARRLSRAVNNPDLARELADMAAEYAERALKLLEAQSQVLVPIGEHLDNANA